LWKSTVLIGKSTINGPFSIAVLNYQRVNDEYIYINIQKYVKMMYWHILLGG